MKLHQGDEIQIEGMHPINPITGEVIPAHLQIFSVTRVIEGATIPKMSKPEPPLCWLCFLSHIATPLDADSRCPIHGLVKDRVLGIVQVDIQLLK